MIKAQDYEDQVKHSRIDAAMRALGFTWDGDEYVSSKRTPGVVVGSENPTRTRKYNKKQKCPECPAVFKNARGLSYHRTRYAKH